MFALAATAGAQTTAPTVAPTLREATGAAWRLSAQARSSVSRQAQLDARDRAAGAFLAGPPVLSLSQQNGRGIASGTREFEAEISAPLWSPSLKRATAGQVSADRATLEAEASAAQLAIAAETRELAAAAALAGVERNLAERKAAEARELVADTDRRVKAGESARIDALRAQSALREAEGAKTAADVSAARTLASWRALTGLTTMAVLDEALVPDGVNPVLVAAEARVRAARAALDVAEADRRDPVEVGLAMVRERPGAGVPSESSWRVSVRVPFGGDARNGPRIAAARADVDEAEAALDSARRHAEADRTAALAELTAAREAEKIAADRERLAREAQELIAKSHRLGESDMPTRLRADTERFEAELARARAAIEARRALSKVNQSSGALP
ncbi:TolC family protein [Variovorax sp. VNK109]|uniref:TolC family protein n=1 Tax=Variovorax sp. VNK109 TaxID=3400919 RepID=UPI003C0DA6E8